jgi:hypothetical protein
MRGRVVSWMVCLWAAVSSGACATSTRSPLPASPASSQAEEAPARQVATSLTRDPLEDAAQGAQAASGDEAAHAHHHHHHGASAPAHAPQDANRQSAAPTSGAAAVRPTAAPESAPATQQSVPPERRSPANGAGPAAAPGQARVPAGLASTPEPQDTPTGGRRPAPSPPAPPVPPRDPAADGGVPPETTEYVCPMHPDVREAKPGRCPRCGMALVPMPVGAPEPKPKSEAGHEHAR